MTAALRALRRSASLSEGSTWRSSEASSTDEQQVGRNMGNTATHFLLYLNEQTYTGAIGEALAEELRNAFNAGLRIAMIHEGDEARGGCW